MHHSVIWGAVNLRAGIVSLMPVDVYRDVAGVPVDMPKPAVLVEPWEVAEGQPMSLSEWLYSTQTALDRFGNNVGIVHSRDSFGIPTRIEPVDPEAVSFRVQGTRIVEYKIAGSRVDSKSIWHERQNTVAGFPVGLSAITHAALALSAGMSAQEFSLAWFQNGGIPSAMLRNTEKTITPEQAQVAKERFKASVETGDVFTVGKDWEYDPISVKASESSFVEQMQYSDVELCRFFNVPADLLDVASMNASAITYASISQRNLQLLVLNMGKTIAAREQALSRLTVEGRYVKLNRSAILAMDDKGRAELFKLQIDSRTMTPDQVRAKEDMAPLTDADYAQFDRLFPVGAPGLTVGG